MKKILFLALAIFIAGCGKEKNSQSANGPQDDSIAKKAGNKVGATLTDFASGIGKGIDKQLEVETELSETLTSNGISKTVSKFSISENLKNKNIILYMLSKKQFKAKLVAKALDKNNLEIGRSVLDVDFADDDAKYITFNFDSQMDSQSVSKYVIDIKN